jgi:hypothetical protein
LIIASAVGYILLALAIYSNTELQIHPMKMFMIMALVDTATLFLMFFAGDICKYRLNEIFAATVFFSTSLEAQYRAAWLLIASKNFFAIYLMFLSNLLNTCLATDLIIMIKHPFKVKEKRLTMYLWFSFGLSALICIAWVLTFDYRPL